MSRPFVHLNFALLAGGKMAGDDGQQVSISCDQDWHRVHLLRESYDAVAVGGRTWIDDRPRLTVRRQVLGREPCRQPGRVIFAGGWRCEVSPDLRPTFVVGKRPDVVGVHVPSPDRCLAEPLRALSEHGVRSLLVEGGATLLRSFFDQSAFDRLTIYVATAEIGVARQSLAASFPWLPALSATRFGDGILFTYDMDDVTAPGLRDRIRRPEAGLHKLLQGRLTYLVPALIGNGDFRGQRIAVMGPVPLPIRVDQENGASPVHGFDWYVFGRVEAGEVLPAGELANSVLVHGALAQATAPLVRVHSGCHTGDVFASLRCDCGAQLGRALTEIVKEGCGVAVYLTEHEGRGIGLWAKAAAYLLQGEGADTYEANRRLGYPEDARRYEDAATVLGHVLRGRRIRMLSNNPAKQQAFEGCGFEVVEMRGLLAGHNDHNRRYLAAKARQGHLLPAVPEEGEDGVE